jgi:hypothetical protein
MLIDNGFLSRSGKPWSDDALVVGNATADGGVGGL